MIGQSISLIYFGEVIVLKIFVIRAKRIFLYFFLALAVLCCIFLSIGKIDNINVFNAKRDLPIYSVETNNKNISITFDCAWGADDIPEILETLKHYNARSTFFLVGHWAEKNPEMVKLIHSYGHDIGNHSHTHVRMSAVGKDRIRSEIERCNNKLTSITGSKIDLFRAPYGDYNNMTVSTARELGCFTIQWNVDSLDWKPGISKETIIERIVSNTKGGSILLFHNDTQHTAKILTVILETLKNKGFNFVPVSELIFKENYYIDFDGTQKTKK